MVFAPGESSFERAIDFIDEQANGGSFVLPSAGFASYVIEPVIDTMHGFEREAEAFHGPHALYSFSCALIH